VAELRAVVSDERVLAAIDAVPREHFLPPELRARAYENVALPIDEEQTISQPLVVARMLELLAPAPGERALDIGTGSGYHAALLARLCAQVITIERHPSLSATAQAALAALGIDNVTCLVGDGCDGLPEAAPFDLINVAASAPSPPPALEDQLALGGRLVMPVGELDQWLVCIRRTPRGLEREELEPVRFVPLIRGRR
jgi:protein-L-isoaspartate(D-aspartate) O-methyltransferase